MNSFGTHFRVTTYGESHGLAVGAIIDGCPPGITLDNNAINLDLARRRTGAPRQETDRIEWLSGLLDGVTLGSPIAFAIHNLDTRSNDYQNLRQAFRPGHADYTYHQKYGLRDHRGGGRASARETTARVVAGAIAKQIIAPIHIHAEVDSLGPLLDNDTCGGTVRCRILNLPPGIGNPVSDKLNAALAAATMSIPSAIGFEMGAGFAAASMTGSQYIDRWNPDATTRTNHCGGIQGGISNGMPVEFRVAFHPVPTLPQQVECLTPNGTITNITAGGRHDRCHVPRTPVIVEAMAAITLANYIHSTPTP